MYWVQSHVQSFGLLMWIRQQLAYVRQALHNEARAQATCTGTTHTDVWLPAPKLLTMYAVHLLHRKPYLLEPPQCTSAGLLPAWLPGYACQLLHSATAALYNAQLPTTSQVPALSWLPFNLVLGLSTLCWAFQHCFWPFNIVLGCSQQNAVGLVSSALHATCDTLCHSSANSLHDICACDILAQLQHANQRH